MNNVKESVQLVHAIGVARKGGGEIEAETIHVHLEHPIAQTVHYQLERARVQEIKGVAGAGEIEIETRIFRP